jgi:hypothetical protein
MNQEPLLFVQTAFTGLFLLTLFGGGYLALNSQRLFGPDPDMPRENSSARSYSRTQALLVWLHATVLTGAFALLLH